MRSDSIVYPHFRPMLAVQTRVQTQVYIIARTKKPGSLTNRSLAATTGVESHSLPGPVSSVTSPLASRFTVSTPSLRFGRFAIDISSLGINLNSMLAAMHGSATFGQ